MNRYQLLEKMGLVMNWGRLRVLLLLASLALLLTSIFLPLLFVGNAFAYQTDYGEYPTQSDIEEVKSEFSGQKIESTLEVHDPSEKNDYRLIVTVTVDDEFGNIIIDAYEYIYWPGEGFRKGRHLVGESRPKTFESTLDLEEEIQTDLQKWGLVKGWPTYAVELDTGDGETTDEPDEEEDDEATVITADGSATPGVESTSSNGAIASLAVGLSGLVVALIALLWAPPGPASTSQLPFGLVGDSGEYPMKPLEGITQPLSGMRDPFVLEYSEIARGFPEKESALMLRVIGDYSTGNIGKDKVRIVHELLKEGITTTDGIEKGYEEFLRREPGKVNRVWSTVAPSAKELIKSMIPIPTPEFQTGQIIKWQADQVIDYVTTDKYIEVNDRQLHKVFKVAKHALKSFDRLEAVKTGWEFFDSGIDAYNKLITETDYPHFREFVKSLDIPEETIRQKLSAALHRLRVEQQRLPLLEQEVTRGQINRVLWDSSGIANKYEVVSEIDAKVNPALRDLQECRRNIAELTVKVKVYEARIGGHYLKAY